MIGHGAAHLHAMAVLTVGIELQQTSNGAHWRAERLDRRGLEHGHIVRSVDEEQGRHELSFLVESSADPAANADDRVYQSRRVHFGIIIDISAEFAFAHGQLQLQMAGAHPKSQTNDPLHFHELTIHLPGSELIEGSLRGYDRLVL